MCVFCCGKSLFFQILPKFCSIFAFGITNNCDSVLTVSVCFTWSCSFVENLGWSPELDSAIASSKSLRSNNIWKKLVKCFLDKQNS